MGNNIQRNTRTINELKSSTPCYGGQYKMFQLFFDSDSPRKSVMLSKEIDITTNSDSNRNAFLHALMQDNIPASLDYKEKRILPSGRGHQEIVHVLGAVINISRWPCIRIANRYLFRMQDPKPVSGVNRSRLRYIQEQCDVRP